MFPVEAQHPRNRRQCTLVALGQREYQEAWELQRALAAARAAGRVGEMLLLLEHPHVFTIGRRGQAEDVLLDNRGLHRLGASLFHVDRGGLVTYHGPGQLVGYPIISLREWGGGPLAYVRSLEQVLIDTLADFDVPGRRIEGLTGVWVEEKKIAAIGVKISRGITTHGFALNVHPDLSYYKYIVPCGIPDREVTAMAHHLERPVPMDEVREAVAHHFGRVLGFAMTVGHSDVVEQVTQIPAPT